MLAAHGLLGGKADLLVLGQNRAGIQYARGPVRSKSPVEREDNPQHTELRYHASVQVRQAGQRLSEQLQSAVTSPVNKLLLLHELAKALVTKLLMQSNLPRIVY